MIQYVPLQSIKVDGEHRSLNVKSFEGEIVDAEAMNRIYQEISERR